MADEVYVAVAANFAAPMKRLASTFEQATGHQVHLSFGATAKFYAQIKQGAPFDVLLAADQSTPARLIDEHAAMLESQFTYATGKLVLWSANKSRVDENGTILKQGQFAHLAIASSQAPYGIAAQQTLAALNLWSTLGPKIVQGESMGQAYSFVASGNADIGLVALSQVWENHQLKSGSVWIVPQQLYTPLHQAAVLLKHGEANSAASALLVYLKSAEANAIIRSYGYH